MHMQYNPSPGQEFLGQKEKPDKMEWFGLLTTELLKIAQASRNQLGGATCKPAQLCGRPGNPADRQITKLIG